MSALDELKMIHERDQQDALGIAAAQPEQYRYNFNFSWQPPRQVAEVIVAGMGGSGLAAKAYRSIGELGVPFDVVQNYDLPKRAGGNTLLICSSYSGNTEETLSVLNQALDSSRSEAAPMVVVIASGGKLLETAKDHGLPYLELPPAYQPRYTFGYQYRALAELFTAASLVSSDTTALEAASLQLADQLAVFLPDVPTADNPAKQLALELMGSSPVVYASSRFFPVAFKWKISFNENAKNVAWCNEFPEFNHNEFLGWTSHPVDKPYKVIDLRSNLDHPQIQKRFDVSDRMLSGKRPAAHSVQLQGKSALEQMVYGIAYGDFVSLYLALLNGINPTPVDIIEKLKAELA